MATYTSNVPMPSVDVTGCHIPTFAAILAGLEADYRGVYGSDVVLTADTQDGQWLGIQATAFKNCADTFLAVYNAFSPATAQGTGLSSVVKVNGIARESASYSTCDVTIVGVVGSQIVNGQVRDEQDNLWTLPAFVTIPTEGQIDVTATCTTIGAITAAAGTIGKIATPTLGWQSVTNAAAATIGSPVETDPQLRVRQSLSTALPSLSLIEAMAGAISGLSGVVRLRAYENDTDVIDDNGLPGHAISIVVDGGDAAAIAAIIAKKKGTAGTYGSAVQTITDLAGIPRDIRFFRPLEPAITYAIQVKALTGFTTAIQAQIQQAVSDWTNALGIGTGIRLTRAYVPANLGGGAGSETFEVLSLAAARDGNMPAAADIAIAFNEAPFCVPANVAITVTT